MHMELKNLVIRSKYLLVNPALEFKKIFEENLSLYSINKSFVLPMALLSAIMSIFGSLLTLLNSPVNSVLYIVINAIIIFFLILSHAYISGKIVTLLGQSIKPTDNPTQYYALSTYSQQPFFIILAIIKLFPSLVFLIFLGLYGGLLFFTGSGTMTKIPSEKRVQFTLLSILLMVITFVILSELFTILYSEVIEQFSTFAAL